ncbi:Esterase lipase thioesterase active site [Coemansia sp. RSA 2337]|nr:Esterase lipase thioesterase active site [Coemansia sp. S17]KAJ2033490.1 Esterase lipase thioesterase active site [Coemansia sp. S3946]KAJ2046517.1 Esterase lipase thioesterase active site [Coemansia sp. S16]KAJ2057772.1 Esterase lipase thioesterase active site [Coemansia sp. S2]KAJ2072311.1 Esterase lipase thioesterase active site [Coemansia sp. S155-1]KAJ2113091.1 Esterase lipase thioesterase active site [Coemansia sp. RSA 922]KAJ2468295.1 Esterase lipase thioesterase active site [Coeman
MNSAEQIVSPYGSWKSPLTAASVASASASVSSVLIDRATNPSRVYWLESRPSEGGRRTLLSKLVDDYSDATLIEHLADTQWNVRTAVHEYGGGAYAVHNGIVVFANWSDQGVYLLDTQQGTPRRIGSLDDKLRYAAFAIHQSGSFVVCVREDHRDSEIEAPAALVAIALTVSQEATPDIVLYKGSDFVSSPAMSVGDEIAFFTWNHPDMNWDTTTLWRAQLLIDSGLPTGLDQLRAVAGQTERESIYQPRFDSEGTLHFISDRVGGFWNPYHVSSNGHVTLSLAKPIDKEFASPEWSFGESTMQPVPGHAPCVVVTYGGEDGQSVLGILDVVTHVFDELPTPGWSVLGDFQFGTTRSGEPVLVLVAGGPTEPLSLFTYYINGMTSTRLSAKNSAVDEMAGFVSVPHTIAFPTRLPSNESSVAEAYAYFYPPTNRNYKAPADELPPLLVLSHGGPTSAAHAVYQPKIQYWTSRGFAVVDVNYGGSTGYGRAYRERLYPQFGVVDVEDCCAAALHLSATGIVDRHRLSIMGGSAGGFTTLACLAFRPEVFAVGASLYGISDLEVLIKETHKFEAQYPVHLVGPYPEAQAVYKSRSPLYSVDTLACPAIFLQGLEDKVVPPNQAVFMVEKLREKGIRVAHLEFEGEQHGFRQAKNIVRALEAQLFFFGKILGFVPADHIEPAVPIYNE